MGNDALARALRELSLFLDMHGVPWRPRAYEKAASSVASAGRPLVELYAAGGKKALTQIPNVGEGIARRLAELLDTGRCRELEELRVRTPVDVLGLAAVEGLGPKHIRQLHDALGVRDVEELARALDAHRVRELPHFGDKSEENLLRAVAFVRKDAGRRPLGEVLELARRIEERLRAIPGVQTAEVAGSVRRRKETIGDLDFLVAARDAEAVSAAFVRMPEVEHVYARGSTKTLVRLRSGLDADLRVVSAASWGAALCYFTGCKAHNVAMRGLARTRGLKLSEYGLFRGAKRIAGRTEQELYRALDLDWVPPELREDHGEIEAAARGALPALIAHGALRGDLQVHTSWTDGRATMEAMALAAQRLGLEYLVITDHTRDLPMAKGSDEERLLAQLGAVRALDRRLSGIRVLAGAEVNIRRDGSLDVDSAVLSKLDVVGAGVHAHFHLPRAEMTARIVRAIRSPHVDVLFHPTGRVLGQRPALDFDLDAVLAEARRTGTALDVDGQPSRLDLEGDHVRRAVAAGVKLVVSSDAHAEDELRYADGFGVAMARRGWATADDVLNTRPLPELLSALKDGGAGRRRRTRT